MSDRYETFVVKNRVGAEIPREAFGGRVVAWASSHALNEMQELEDFVRSVCSGQVVDPESAAEELMDKMGWA